VQPVQAAANTEAVKRARNQATVVTCAAATVPTVLAMQGMASLAVDLLGFAVVVAIALAGFLELALISFALLTRASALAGRPGGVDAAAVWGVSLASGTFSAMHELVGPAIGSTRSWQVDPGSLLAACVRLTAPLVAALLWERVLTAARREHEARSLVQVRRDHRLIAVAQAALTVRQLSEDRPHGRRPTARLRRARRRLQRAHVTALRMTGVGPDLFEVLAAVGAVDILPAATIPPGRSGTRPDTVDGDQSGAVHLSDTPTGGPDTRGAQVPAVLSLSDTSAVLAGGADTGSDTLDGHPSSAVHVSDTLTGGPNTGSDTLDGHPSTTVHVSDTPTGGPDTWGEQVPAVLSLSDTLSDMSAVLSDRTDAGSDTLDGDPSSAVNLSDIPAGGPDTRSNTSGGQDGQAVYLSDTQLRVSDTWTGQAAAVVSLSDTLSGGLDSLSDTSGVVSDTSTGAVVVPDPLTIAVALVRNDRQVAGSRIAAAMRRHGHTVTDRTGLRWRDRAVNHLATELTRDLSDTSNDEVRSTVTAS
jgi:hypothetical protein